MGDGRVDQRDPKHEEYEVGRELETLNDRPCDQGRCDDGEHHLKHGEQHFVAGLDAAETKQREISHEGPAFAERDAVPPEYPNHTDDGHAHEAEHDGADDVMAANKASIEEGQSRRHQQHHS